VACVLVAPSSLQGRTKSDGKCYTLFYLPNDNPEVNAIMTTLAERNKLNISIAHQLSPQVLSLSLLLCRGGLHVRWCVC
jgi:hypothetical protein